MRLGREISMGGKKPPPKKSDEEKEAEKKLKACVSMLKACKDDELKKVEEAVGKGADINYQNENGHTAAHMAAAYGALSVLRYLHKQGADLEIINAVCVCKHATEPKRRGVAH